MIDVMHSSDEELADAVICGWFGDGRIRKRRLGSRYDAVQAIVNRKLEFGQDAEASFKELKDGIDECISILNKLSNADSSSLEALENELRGCLNIARYDRDHGADDADLSYNYGRVSAYKKALLLCERAMGKNVSIKEDDEIGEDEWER